MRLLSLGGGGSGSRLTVMNVTSWTGNYSAAGVNAIQMSVRNLGSADLTLRLAFETLGAMGPTDTAVSTAGIPLAAGGDWTTVVFPVDVASLTALMGSTATVLSDVDVVRIFHNPTANFPPEALAASLGVDNIMAIGPLAIPEPATLLLTGAALGMIARRRRR
jgi:hypothetical protein